MKLLQSLNAKLFHDLAGSIGVVNNCLEILDHKNLTIKHKAKELLSYEAKRLMYKLRLYRFAYGVDGNQVTSFSEVAKLLEDFFSGSKIALQINHPAGLNELDLHLAKIIVSLADIVSDTIFTAERFIVELSIDNSRVPTKLIVQGKKLTPKAQHLSILNSTTNVDMYSNNVTLSEKGIDVIHKVLEPSIAKECYIKNLCLKNGYGVLVESVGENLEYTIRKNNDLQNILNI